MSPRVQSFVDRMAMRTRLLVAFGSLTVVIAAFQMWYFPGRQVSQAREDLLVKARTTTRLVTPDIGAAFDFSDATAVAQVFERARGDPDLSFLVLFAANGSRFAALNPERAPAAAPPDLNAMRHEFRADDLVLYVPILTAGKTRGTLVAGFQTDRFIAMSRDTRLAALWSAAIVLLVGLVVTVLMSRQVAARLDPINVLSILRTF